MGKSAYKAPPSVQAATEAAQSRVQNGLLGPIDNSVVDAMAQRALALSQLPCHSDMQYQLQRAAQQQFNMSTQSQLYQNQLQQQLDNLLVGAQQYGQLGTNALMNVPQPPAPCEAHILAYRSRPKWGRVQERAATIVAFAALLPPILAVPIINRQTRIIAT